MKLPEKGPDKMFTGKNVVVIKNEDKTQPPTVTVYDRVYLENASTDKSEDYTKTSEGKTLQLNGQDWKGIKPAGVTTANPEDLIPEALAYFQSKYPGTAEKPNSPWLTLLEAASYGADLWERNKIQSSSRPSKPIDAAAAVEKAIKLVMALNPKMSRDKAMVIAKAMAESASEESQEQAA